MSVDWSAMFLGDFVELKRGYDLPKRVRVEGSVPIISSGGKTGSHSLAKVKGPGVVTGRYGTIGEVYYIEEDFWPLNTTLYVNDFKGNDSLFVYYFLKTIRYADYSDKAAVPGVNRNHLHTAEIRVPVRVEEQRLLALHLRTLDQKIAINTKINQTLEQIVQAIFKSWFVDFEPVKAKIAVSEAGGTKEQAELTAMSAISGLPMDASASSETEEQNNLGKLRNKQPEAFAELAQTAALFPSAMQDSELGEIPEEWEPQRLDSIIELAYGKALTKAKRIAGRYPVYGSGGITGSHNKALVKGPGIIVGRKGTVGSLYWEHQDFFPIDTTFYVILKADAQLIFIYSLLKTLGLTDMNTDAAVPGLNRNNVYRLMVPKFPAKLVQKFSKLSDKFFEYIHVKENENKNFKSIRDTLLPKLLSGEIDLTQTSGEGNEVSA